MKRMKVVVECEFEFPDDFAIAPDRDGNYRVSLPPGDYVLDVQGRRPGGVRANPQTFTVFSNQTVRIDMNIDTGIR